MTPPRSTLRARASNWLWHSLPSLSAVFRGTSRRDSLRRFPNSVIYQATGNKLRAWLLRISGDARATGRVASDSVVPGSYPRILPVGQSSTSVHEFGEQPVFPGFFEPRRASRNLWLDRHQTEKVIDRMNRQKPSTGKRRSLRLRKKLRIGEFREDGFEVHFKFKADLTNDEQIDALMSFITEAIESRRLLFGGGESGFVTKAGRGSTTEDDRDAVHAWLRSCPSVVDVRLGPNEDAWYGSSEGDT